MPETWYNLLYSVANFPNFGVQHIKDVAEHSIKILKW